MKMEKKVLSVLLILMVSGLFSPVLFAQEAESGKSESFITIDREKAERHTHVREKPRHVHPVDPPPPHRHDDDSDILDSLVSITAALSVLNLLGTSYSDYPYADGTFVHFDLDHIDLDGKMSWFTLGGSADYWYKIPGTAGVDLGKTPIGGEAYMQGQFFKFIGPQINYSAFTIENNYQHLLEAGVRFGIFESNPFSLGWYIQYANFAGQMNESGCNLGLDIWSLPFKPLSLKLATEACFFDKYIMFVNKAQIGVFAGRTELYGGVKHINLKKDSSKSSLSQNLIFYAGIGIYL